MLLQLKKIEINEMCSELSEMARTLINNSNFFAPDIGDDVDDDIDDDVDDDVDDDDDGSFWGGGDLGFLRAQTR